MDGVVDDYDEDDDNDDYYCYLNIFIIMPLMAMDIIIVDDDN